MSNTQPEALHIANSLYAYPDALAKAAAAELRRLHDENEVLRSATKLIWADRDRLKALNDELRAILERIETVAPNVVRVARSAIAKATGEQA